jgi:hypothetical protein
MMTRKPLNTSTHQRLAKWGMIQWSVGEIVS